MSFLNHLIDMLHQHAQGQTQQGPQRPGLPMAQGGVNAAGQPHPQSLDVAPTAFQPQFRGVQPPNTMATNQHLWAGASPLQVGFTPTDLDAEPGGGYLQYGRQAQRQHNNFAYPLQGLPRYSQDDDNINQIRHR